MGHLFLYNEQLEINLLNNDWNQMTTQNLYLYVGMTAVGISMNSRGQYLLHSTELPDLFHLQLLIPKGKFQYYT